MRAIITHRTQHSLLNFIGWCICPQWLSCSSGNSVASVFQTARIFVVCLISKMICLLSVNPRLVWIPSSMLSIFFVFCKSYGLQLLFTTKISFYNILKALEEFVKIWCMMDQKLQKDQMLSNRVPQRDTSSGRHIELLPSPSPKLRHSLRPEPLDGQLAQS